MSERINRRDEMIEAASELFLKQGYAGTSIQQIADAVGCTKAALYYHFKEGKEALLQEVLHLYMPDMMEILKGCEGATSLQDLIIRFGYGLMGQADHHLNRLRWVTMEYPNFNSREQDVLHAKQIKFHCLLADQAQRFVENRQEAEQKAWQIMCSFCGYGLFFINLDLQSVVNLPREKFLQLMADTIACGQ